MSDKRVPVLPALISAVALAAMIFVPMTALDDERPSRFGWHMYSAIETVPSVTVINSDGETEDVAFLDEVVRYRPEADLWEPLARRLCATRNAVRVRIVRDEPAYWGEFSCASF